MEVKHGTMVFDSSLIIVTSNIAPGDMALACGRDNEDAMYRRFTDTCGSHLIANVKTARNNLVEHLVKVIARNVEFNHDVDIDVEYVIRSIPGVRNVMYDVELMSCDCKKYFQ